jgi:hypothetical protein
MSIFGNRLDFQDDVSDAAATKTNIKGTIKNFFTAKSSASAANKRKNNNKVEDSSSSTRGSKGEQKSFSKKVKVKEQSFIDLGQKSFNRSIQCDICGTLYTKVCSAAPR